MWQLAIVAIFLMASSVIFADDAGESPVMPVFPVDTNPVPIIVPIQTLWTVQPIEVQLLRALTNSVSEPSQIQALISQLAPEDIARIVVSIADNCSALSALVSQLTPLQVKTVMGALVNNGNALTAFVANLDTDKLILAINSLAPGSSALKVMVTHIHPARLIDIIAALSKDPKTVKIFADQVANIDRWTVVNAFLASVPTSQSSLDWIAAAKFRLQRQIQKYGYTSDNLAEAEALMTKAKQEQKP